MIISAADNLYPAKTAVMLNPLSGRIRKRIDTIRVLAHGIPGAVIREASTLAELNHCVDEFSALAVDHLVIAGGDGTVHAVLNRLLAGGLWRKPPVLSIIPGGTTNMTATDIGSRGSPEKNLRLLTSCLQRLADARLVTRPVLRIEQNNQSDIYGMFFGAGIISHGAGFFHKHIKKSGLTGEIASAIVIFHLLTGLLFGRKLAELKPARIRLLDDSKHPREYNCTILFASTLDRLLLGLRPYWGTDHGPVHTTCIRESPKKFWRSLLTIISRRGGHLSEQDGYYSRNNESLELFMDEEYIVDGEFFCCESRHGPLRISATKTVRFLLP